MDSGKRVSEYSFSAGGIGKGCGSGTGENVFLHHPSHGNAGIIVASVFTFLGSLEESQGTLLVGFPQIKTMPVELYGVIMQYPITAGPVLSLLLIIPTIVILVALRKYVGPEAIAKGYNMK